MNDSDIAPLAQRLAEENNVDWRRLAGSGPNGRIVEKDVLEYLARVMAGEEAVDPTPEPLPEGMDAWPEEERSAPSEAPRPYDAAAGGNGAPTGRDDDDLLLAGDDLAADEDEDLLMPPSEPRREEPTRAEDLPDLFDDGGGERSSGRGESPALFDGEDAAADRRASAGEAARADRGSAPERREADLDLDFGGFPGAEEGPRSGGHEPASRYDEPAPEPTGRYDEFASEPAPRRDEGWTLDEPDRPARSEPSVELDWSLDDEEPAPAPRDEVFAEGTTSSEPPAPPEAPPAEAPVGATSTPVEPAAEGPADAAAVPVARSRQVLRRHVDLGGALAVGRLLSAEGTSAEHATVALLWVAARREAGILGLSRPAVADVAGGRPGAILPSGSTVGEVAGSLAEADAGSGGEADLWIADLSGLGLDDAVLDVDGVQLTLGRLLADGEDGATRATLALAGDVPVERGADFLGRVARILEEPLRLVV